MSIRDLIKVLKGGPGSGNFGHAGRPGMRGGSAGGGKAGGSVGSAGSGVSKKKLSGLVKEHAKRKDLSGTDKETQRKADDIGNALETTLKPLTGKSMSVADKLLTSSGFKKGRTEKVTDVEDEISYSNGNLKALVFHDKKANKITEITGFYEQEDWGLSEWDS